MATSPQHPLVRSVTAWCIAGPMCGAIAFIAVFFSPVLFGQPMKSMVMWGWATTTPAAIAGIFCAGKACTLLLARWSLPGADNSSFAIGGIIAVVLYAAVMLLVPMLGFLR
jgi:hypothetical protein